MDMPWMTITILPYIDKYLTIKRASNFEWQKEWKNSNRKYAKSNHALKSAKVPTTFVGNLWLCWVGSVLDTLDLMSRNN